MSRLRPTLLLLTLVAAAPAQAQAQRDPVAVMREQAALIDSLAPEAVRIGRESDERSARVRAEAARIDVALDTMQLGPLTVVGMVKTVRALAPALTDEWQRMEALYGAAADRLPPTTLVLTYPYDSGLHALAAQHVALWLSPLTTRRMRHRRIQWTLASQLADVLPTDVQEWLDGVIVPASVDDADAYRLLVLRPGRANAACRAGDAAACGRALGLRDPGADYAGWYDAAELEAARDAGTGEVSAPLPASARSHFLAFAFSTFPGSAGRLHAQQASTVGERIAGATGQPLDSLTAAWQRRVIAGAPEAPSSDVPASFAALLWVAVFATLASRSTRWRVG